MTKRNFRVVLTVALAIAFGTSSASAAASTLEVTPSGTDAGNCIGSACATIGYAVGQAVADDTIEVAAGNYDEQVEITVPGLTLDGAGGATVIGPQGSGIVEQTEITLADGVNGVTLRDLKVVSRAQAKPAILATGSEAIDDVTLDGVTVFGVGPSTIPSTIGSGLEVNAPAAGWTIVDSTFADNYHGVLVNSDMTDLTIEGASYVDNRNGLYVARSLPLGPDSTGTVDGLQLSDSRFEGNEYRGLYFEGLSDAVIDGVVVTGTGEGMASLPTGARALHLNLKAGEFGDVEVSDSSFSGSVNEGVAVQVRGYPGDTSYEATPATLASFRLTHSSLVGNGGPGLVVDNQANLGAVSVTGSRIVGNGNQAPGATTPVDGVFAWNGAVGAPTVDAAENWFACNEGPAAGSCAAVNAPVQAPTWLALTVDTSFQTLRPGEQTVAVAAIEKNTGGEPLLAVPDGATAQFSSPLGSFDQATVPLLSGVASSSFTAVSLGSDAVTVAVDGEKATSPITVQPPDEVLPPPPPTAPPAPQPPAPQPPTIKPPAGNGPSTVPNNGTVTVATVGCAAESCAVKAQGAPKVKIGDRSYKVQVKLPKALGAGDSGKVRVVLPKLVREALAEEGKGKLRLKLKVTGSDGSTRTVTVTLVLKGKGAKAKGG